MSPAHPDRPTESSPPRKPRGARRWVWVAVPSLLALAYVGTYATMRTRRALTVATYFSGGEFSRAQVIERGWPFEQPTWVTSSFRPCIAVEEWWRNR